MGNATSLCVTCGAEFVPATPRRGHPDTRFCTAACRALRERTHGPRIIPGPASAGAACAAEMVEPDEAVDPPAGSLEVVGSVKMAEPVELVRPVEVIGADGTAGADAGRPAPLPPLGTEHCCPHCGHQFAIVNFVMKSLDSAG
ncbi:hypothetical protein [Streptomyces sp. CAU 1734]|uniref:hypothetical protein n=1 Tax=Streptomyces sp. CAU 1734 TaxID=3140360 RepID=UPI003260282D